jgi:hypothetical protein
MKINNFVLIIGAMKCGTTSLFNYLSEHPEISRCRYKEPHFFEDSDRFYKGFDYYQSLWDWNPDIHKIALEANPGYTKFTHPKNLNAAKNIFQIQTDTNANFKFIYIMRNPLDRIESHCNHLDRIKLKTNNFKQNVISEVISEIDRNITIAGINKWIIDTSKYAMQLEEYYKRFDKNNIILLDFEDLKKDPINVVKKVCQFLDVDSNYEFKNLNTIHNNSHQKVNIIMPGYNFTRKTKVVKLLVQLLPDEIKKSFRTLFGRKIERQVYLSAEQKKYILNELKADLNKLKNDYGLEIDRWNIKV